MRTYMTDKIIMKVLNTNKNLSKICKEAKGNLLVLLNFDNYYPKQIKFSKLIFKISIDLPYENDSKSFLLLKIIVFLRLMFV